MKKHDKEQVSFDLVDMFADTLSDLEKVRIATENRLRSMTETGVSEKGHEWGRGLGPDDPNVQQYAIVFGVLDDLEKNLIEKVEAAVSNSPYADWVKDSKGLGAKQVGRLLAAVKDPYWQPIENRPRTVNELWSYCGLAAREGKIQKRVKGSQSNWNADAKMRAYLIAKSVEKQKSGHYREIYDAQKVKYADAVHKFDCPQCHAKVGEPLKPGHIQSRALRKVAKEVLKDLWLISRDLHKNAVAA